MVNPLPIWAFTEEILFWPRISQNDDKNKVDYLCFPHLDICDIEKPWTEEKTVVTIDEGIMIKWYTYTFELQLE